MSVNIEKIKGGVDSATKSVKKNLKSIIMDLAVVGVSVAYVLYKTLNFEKTDLNPILLFIEAIVGIIVGLLIKIALGENGLLKGYKSDKWTRPKQDYDDKSDIALAYVDKVDKFYEDERVEKLEKTRKVYLAGYRMKYSFFYDDNGDYIERNIIKEKDYLKAKKKGNPMVLDEENDIVLDRKQIRALKHSIKIKIYIKNLFTEYESAVSEDTHPETTDNDMRKLSIRKNALTASAISMLGVYFVPKLVNFDWGEIIMSLLQVMLWIILGILELYKFYNYVTIEKVATLKLKDKSLTKFLKRCHDEEKANPQALKEREEFAKFIAKKKEELKEQEQPKVDQTPTEEIVVEMTEEELKAKGLIH